MRYWRVFLFFLSAAAGVKRDSQNNEYLLELFDFYVESPEWFDGGLQRAATLLEPFRPADSDPGSLLRKNRRFPKGA